VEYLEASSGGKTIASILYRYEDGGEEVSPKLVILSASARSIPPSSCLRSPSPMARVLPTAQTRSVAIS